MNQYDSAILDSDSISNQHSAAPDAETDAFVVTDSSSPQSALVHAIAGADPEADENALLVTDRSSSSPQSAAASAAGTADATEEIHDIFATDPEGDETARLVTDRNSSSPQSVAASAQPAMPTADVTEEVHDIDTSIPHASNVHILRELQLPVVAKKRGRPASKQNFTSKRRRKHRVPTKFRSLSAEEKVAFCLAKLDLGRGPEELSPAFLEVGADQFQESLTRAQYVKLKQLIGLKKSQNLYKCPSCSKVDNGQLQMVECEHYLDWFHYHCTGYDEGQTTWFCRGCWSA